MDNFSLKVLACITMLIDHIGAILFPNVIIFRVIGRIAFPIYAFLIAEGYRRTRNIKKYMIRLGVLALLSQVPFMIAFNSRGLNVFFTLLGGLLAIWVWDKEWDFNKRVWLIILIVVLVSIFDTDYSVYGIATIFIFNKYSKKSKVLWRAIIGLNSIYTLSLWEYLILPSGGVNFRVFLQALSLSSLIFISRYNGEEGRKMKGIFYVFYPVHLCILILIRYLIYR